MSIYEGMARVNPSQTVARIEQLGSGAERDQLLSIAVNEWAKQDVHATFDWIEKASMTPSLNGLYQQVMGKYIEYDPIQAAALVAGMEPGSSQTGFAASVATKLAEVDVVRALEWAKTLQGDANHEAMANVMKSWASGKDGVGALQHILNNPEQAQLAEMLSAVANSVAKNHPDVLISAMPTLDSEGQRVVAEQLAISLSQSSPDKFKQWFATLGPGPVRDNALQVAMKNYMSTSVNDALSLAESITDKFLRDAKISEVMEVWLPLNPDAAHQALQNCSTLSAQQRQAFAEGALRNAKSNNMFLPSKP
jgi:hypothetical protein